MKKVILVGMLLAMLMCLCGCNYQVFDSTYSFDLAIISLPDGALVYGEVQSWRDFDDGDQIQVKIDDVTYLVHSENVALIAN